MTIKTPVYSEPHAGCWKIYDADYVYLCTTDTRVRADQIVSALNAQQDVYVLTASGNDTEISGIYQTEELAKAAERTQEFDGVAFFSVTKHEVRSKNE